MTALEYILAAIRLGIEDSLNPYILAGILVFLGLLAFIGNTPEKIKLAAKYVVISVVAGMAFLFSQMNSQWLNAPPHNAVVRFLSLGVSVFLLTGGYLLFKQWWRCRSASAQWRPAFLAETAQSSQKNIGIVFFSVIVGLAEVVLVSLWPQIQNSYTIYYMLLTSGNVLLATLFFVLYSLAFVFFLIIICVIIFYIKRSEGLRRRLVNAISLVYISFSALFVAAGFGLIYLFNVT